MNYLELSKIPFLKFKEKAIISLIEHEENIKECIGYLLNYDYSFDKIIIVSKNIKVNKIEHIYKSINSFIYLIPENKKLSYFEIILQLISLNRLNRYKKVFIFPKFIGPYSSELNKLYTSELNSESIKIFIDSTITFFEDKKSDLKIHPLNFQFKENINKKEKEFINAFISPNIIPQDVQLISVPKLKIFSFGIGSISLSLISEIKYYREDFKNLIKINLGDNYNIDQLFLPILLSIDKNLNMSYL